MRKIIYVLLSVCMVCFLGACSIGEPVPANADKIPDSSQVAMATAEPVQKDISPSPVPTPEPLSSDSQTDYVGSYGTDPSTWCGPDPDSIG